MSYLDKVINLGLGAISLTKEKAEAFIDELVERGEISKEDAKQTLDDVMKKGEEHKEEFRIIVRNSSLCSSPFFITSSRVCLASSLLISPRSTSSSINASAFSLVRLIAPKLRFITLSK